MIIIISSFVGILIFLSPSQKTDATDPIIEINSPVNINYDLPTHLLSISASDNIAVDAIWYNWKGVNVTYFSEYYITFDEGFNTIQAWANDSAGNLGTTIITFAIDTTNPIMEIESPMNKMYNNATQLLTISTSDNVAVDTIWYNWNGVDVTYSSAYYITFDEGLNTIHAWVNDSVGHISTTSLTFSIDTTVPIVEIESLLNTTYYIPMQLLNISASDDVAVETIWYNWNGVDVTYTSAHYITFDEGLNTIYAWVNDSVGNIGTTSLTFTMDIIDLDLSFISVWNTSLTSTGNNGDSSPSEKIKLPLQSGGIYNFTVNWGDGNNDTITSYNQPEVIHTYALEGVYTIEIKGILIGWRFNFGGDRLKLLEIKEWGALRLGNSGSYFYACSNLNLTASDTLDLNGTTSLYRAFSGCENLGTTGSLNSWDVSSVTTMRNMFAGATSFNKTIDDWDVSNVRDMNYMFILACSFNQPIGKWDVSSVTTMNYMFHYAYDFNQPIGSWDVSNVRDMSYLLTNAYDFNQPIGNWNVSSVTNMKCMLGAATSFNQPIGNWNVSNVKNMAYMFSYAYDFNQDINSWNVSSVTDMTYMFQYTSFFNQPIGNWDVSSVTNMKCMFYFASSFNQNINSWDVSSVTDMINMFASASSFNQPIGNWNVSSVIWIAAMFYQASSFNQDLSNWDVSHITNMNFVFQNASSFNQNISSWDVSSVQSMRGMFANATSFNQNISSWDVSNVRFMSSMFYGVTLSTQNYDSLLIGWEQLTLWSGVFFDGGNSQYSAAATTARANIISNYGWTITDGGASP